MSSSEVTHARLLDTATELFYAEGIAATGVDKVVARAGVSKPTLYAHFRSKDELVAAVLERRHCERVAGLDAWVRAHADSPRERLLAVFDWLADWHASGEGERGCAFVNAAAEVAGPGHPAREVARRHKRWMREYLAGLASEAGLSDPTRLGSDLMLLVDGANARVTVDGDLAAAADARRLAALIIDACQEQRV
ncbi:MAG: TetR/AcrR family transcriptional regulator [Actinomycetota bacterium]|nr:TetR/AcrR family transcriptional regulator [Actinomycetota bacterium]